jgi:hypothetical protein
VLSKLPTPPTQPRCRYCGEIIPPGDRRPREYCSDAHRKAAARTRRTPSWLLPQRPGDLNAPTAESTKNGVEKTNKINGRIFGQNGPSVPVNLFGRGYRWPGAKTNGNAVRVAAAVDAELGVGVRWSCHRMVSPRRSSRRASLVRGRCRYDDHHRRRWPHEQDDTLRHDVTRAPPCRMKSIMPDSRSWPRN